MPAKWTPAYTTQFIKERYGGDPFTVIAFLDDDMSNGFIVLEISRVAFNPPLIKVYDNYGNFYFWRCCRYSIFYCGFAFVFQGNSQRLLHLQEAMEIRDVDGLPIEIHVKRETKLVNWSTVLIEWSASCEKASNANKRRATKT